MAPRVNTATQDVDPSTVPLDWRLLRFVGPVPPVEEGVPSLGVLSNSPIIIHPGQL